MKDYLQSGNFKLLVFSFLNGSVLFHKIALLNKDLRKKLTNSALLDQDKVIRIKKRILRQGKLFSELPDASLCYANSFADAFEFKLHFKTLDYLGYLETFVKSIDYLQKTKREHKIDLLFLH